jgi:hypothetical protein
MYRFYMSREARLLGADWSQSPRHALNTASAVHPRLGFWSDMAYIAWTSVDPAGRVPLNIARMSINNEETQATIECVCSKQYTREFADLVDHEDEVDPPKSPGLSFPVDSDEAKLLLQTRHGKGVAWFFPT